VIAETQTAAITEAPAHEAIVDPASVLTPKGVVSIDVTFLVRAALAASP